MKLALQFKTLPILLLVPLFVLANANNNDKHTKSKTIKKEFSVNKYATLKVSNSYGNVDVITWEENRISIEVSITTSGNDQEKVQKKLDEITVDFEMSENYVSARTNFNSDKSKSWFNWGNNNNVNMKINYLIKLPITNNVDLNNDYGTITLDKLKGHAKISCDYGKIITKELLGDNNTLSFDYTRNCYFEYIKNGKINADYSGFTVSKTNDLEINADYTDSKIEIAENITYNCDYGKMDIGKVNNVNGNGDYLTTIIGDVYKNVTIKADYGSIKINRMAENAGNISINSDYLGIKIGYAPNYNFNFDINLDYGSLNGDNDFEFTKKTIESSSKHYIGYRGTNASGNSINITSDYGSLMLYKN